MDQSSQTLRKLLRVLQFRQHLKELTSACKRINKDGCYEFVTSRAESISPKDHRTRSKRRSKSTCALTNADHLSRATAQSPANLSMLVYQSYKPLHVKSSQLDKNTIAVTKGTTVNALYTNGNWVFIEMIETGQRGYVPMYCLRFLDSMPTNDSASQDNISLLNVSVEEKNDRTGEFISSIGTCHSNGSSQTFQRSFRNDQSALSQEISQISLQPTDHEIYQSYSRPTSAPNTRRRRAIETYQKQFLGDISVLESEVLTVLDDCDSNDDWHFVRRGDGKQGYVPKHILILDPTLS